MTHRKLKIFKGNCNDRLGIAYLLEQLGEVLAKPLAVIFLGPAALAGPPALPVAFLGADGDAIVILREENNQNAIYELTRSTAQTLNREKRVG